MPIVNNKLITVVGLGYIGLPTAALLAVKGYQVKGVDINSQAVDTINQGRIHIVEPDLDAFVKSAVLKGNLKAYLTVQPADVYMLCVPTPFHEGEGTPTPNVDYIRAAAQSIAPLVKAGDSIILESTCPVGTTELVCQVLSHHVDIAVVYIAYCPERVLPGKIMTELVENDRVIGGINTRSTKMVAEFYKTFVSGKILETTARVAEMCKLTENSFRDVNIAFANELSLLCANNGVDVWELIRLANHHPRVNILQPGTGVGGHCIAVDPWFLVAGDPENATMIRTAREINNLKPQWVVDQILDNTTSVSQKASKKASKKVLCLGLAFKPDIDDLRESAAITVADALIAAGCDVWCVEPNIEKAHSKYQLVEFDAIKLADFDVIAILVKHRQFVGDRFQKSIADANVLDFCGALADCKDSLV